MFSLTWHVLTKLNQSLCCAVFGMQLKSLLTWFFEFNYILYTSTTPTSLWVFCSSSVKYTRAATMWRNSVMTHFTVLEDWLSVLEAQQYSLEFSESQGSNSQSFIWVVPMYFLKYFTIFMSKFPGDVSGAVLIGPWYWFNCHRLCLRPCKSWLYCWRDGLSPCLAIIQTVYPTFVIRKAQKSLGK